MRLSLATVFLYLNFLALAAPPLTPNSNALSVRDNAFSEATAYNDLEKRRGGGGGKGGGGGSGGKGGYGGSGGSGRSGTPPAYGGRFYGGASQPYSAGAKTPTRGISPGLYPIGAFAFFPAFWIFPVYAYPYGYGYHWNDNGRNRTSNVTCLCEQYSECGCDPDGNNTFLAQQLTNGQTSGAPVNSTNVRTINWPNGTTISYINGTLANGTTLGDDSSAARLMVNFSGYWLMIATVIAGVTLV